VGVASGIKLVLGAFCRLGEHGADRGLIADVDLGQPGAAREGAIEVHAAPGREVVEHGHLVAARGRWLPVMPGLVKTDQFWTNPKDPHIPVAVKQELQGPTQPWFHIFNPAYADVNAQQVWGKAEANVMQGGMTPAKAVDAAFKQIDAIFAKYPVPKQ